MVSASNYEIPRKMKKKKIENLSKEIEITKKEPNENYRTEKYNH